MTSIVVDAHQHFWTYGTYQTSWMEKPPYAGDPAINPLRRSFSPDDLVPELAAASVNFTVIVEAADHEAENLALAAYAQDHDWVAGVVGWVPLDQPEKAALMLDELNKNPKFVGVRHLINVEPDPAWILRAEVIEGLKLVAEHGLAFDFVGILPSHLKNISLLAERIPQLRIVIDHLGKPPIAAGSFEPWCSQLKQIAQFPNVYAKLSGLDAGISNTWSATDIAPYINHAVAVFGTDRLMFGSDWPVANMRGGYGKIWRETQVALSHLSSAEKGRIFGGTAVKFYQLKL